MISESSLKHIALVFCGDIAELYSYKSGPVLVSFFNQYFRKSDTYGQGFPSRWLYVYNNLTELLNSGQFDKFLTIMFSKEFIISDLKCTTVVAAERSQQALDNINQVLKSDMCIITHNQGKYHLVKENDDLILIGEGGFAKVYHQKSTGLIVKKLRDDFLTKPAIRSRFKREYDITKSLESAGIVKVYDFDESTCSYTMEKAETTLEQFVNNSQLNDETRIRCIRQILSVFKEVHDKNIIHRDISPNNIFIISGVIKIADFGLGKDLNVFHSHQTVMTNSFGQYWYCAPEQFMLLKEADKRSDVFSMGRLINFIMTQDPTNKEHRFKGIVEKATNENTSFRYPDAGALLASLEKSISNQDRIQNEADVLAKIASQTLDESVELFIAELPNDRLCQMLIEKQSGFFEALLLYMQSNDARAQSIIQGIDNEFRGIYMRFENYDIFAKLSYKILLDQSFSFPAKELAAGILRYVAVDANRFSAQRLIQNLTDSNIDPNLVELLS